jgi:stage V sporulation protein B
MATFRGYFQGMNTMVPTAISQIIEQIFNAVFSIYLAYILLGKGIELGAAGGTLGTGVGALTGLIFLVFIYLIIRPGIIKRYKKSEEHGIDESFKSIFVSLVKISVPIITGTAIFSIANLIDSKMVMSRLQLIGYTNKQASALYGQMTGKFLTLSNLPVSIATALAVAVIPSIAASMALKQRENVKNKVNLAMKVTMLLAAPSAVGLLVLGPQIITMLFPKYPDGGFILQVGAVTVIFLSITQVATAILQGVGKVQIPAINAGVGVFVKIGLNFFLLTIPAINILGAVISTIACYIVVSFLNMKAMIRFTHAKIRMMDTFIKPTAAALGMGIFSFSFYKLLFWALQSNTLATIGSVFLSGVVYFGILSLSGGITQAEIRLYPMGTKISQMMMKIGLLR